MIAVSEDEARAARARATFSPTLALTASKLRLLARSDVGDPARRRDRRRQGGVRERRARAASARAGKLVAINCAAIPRELVESELFGYEKGAHSTAQARKIGPRRGGERRDAVPRRDRRHAAGAAVEAAAVSCRTGASRRSARRASSRSTCAIIAATSRVALEKGSHVQEAMLGRLGAQPIVLPPLRERDRGCGAPRGLLPAQTSPTSARSSPRRSRR